MFCETVRIVGVLSEAENGVVFKQAIDYVEGLARSTGDDPSPEDAEPVRHMRIEAHGTIVVPEVARVEGGEQRALLNSEPLTPATRPRL